MPKLACDTKQLELDEEFLFVFSPTERKSLKNFNFSESEIAHSELQYLLRVSVENNDVFSEITYYVGKLRKNSMSSRKKHAKLRKQQLYKFPLHYKDGFKILSIELQQAGIIHEVVSDVEMVSVFTNPFIILPTGDTVKLVIDARYFNSVTDLSNYSWLLEPAQKLLTNWDAVHNTKSEMASAYKQVPFSEDTKKRTTFVVGGRQYIFERGFSGLCGLPNFLSQIITINFAEMIAEKQAITHIEYVILQASIKNDM